MEIYTMDDSDIVEIYSAANSIEAYAMANALKAAGVKARVVGDMLGTAAGGLAVGEPIAPRVWIRRQDEAHARGLLKQWKVDAKIPSEQQQTE
jgi:hypothetical protein